MPRYTHRPLYNANEFIAMQQFTARMAIQQAPYIICLPGDLAWWRGATPDDSGLAGIRLWERDNIIVGWTWETDDQVDTLYDTRYPDLWPVMVAYLAQHTAPTTSLWAFEKNPTRHSALRANGYTQHPLALNQHYQPTKNAPVFALPNGWTANILSEADIPQRVLAQRSAFKSTIMTEERYNFSRALPGYTPNWDMVAVNDAGEIGAFCTVWVDDWSNYALFEPVGCRQEYQRTGLTRGLISTTLQRLAAAGIDHASVLSDGNPDNPAQFFYAACGFQFVDRLSGWLRSSTTPPQQVR